MKKITSNKINLINKVWYCHMQQASNIIRFVPRTNETLTDKELVSILMGFIKMIRKDERNKIIQALSKTIKP